MTIKEIRQALPKQKKSKPAAKPKPAKAQADVSAVRPADSTAQQFADRVRILIENVLYRPNDHSMGLKFIHKLASELAAEAPAVDLGPDKGLRYSAERIVKALEITDLSPEQLVGIVESYEIQGVRS